MPCPCGASNDPITSPVLLMWIIVGGRTQQCAVGGFVDALSSCSVGVVRPVEDPDVVVPVHGQPGDAAHLPVVRERPSARSGSNTYRGAPCCASTPVVM